MSNFRGPPHGEYLHAPQRLRDDKWWNHLKDIVKKSYEGLENATRGNLLGVPLRHPEKNSFSIRAELWEPNDKRAEIMDELMKSKRSFRMDIKFFDELVKQGPEL